MSGPSKAEDPLISLFKSIGLSQAKAVEAAKSPKAAATLKNLIDKYSLTSRDGGVNEKTAGLIAALAGQLAKTDVDENGEKFVLDRILDGKLKSVDQVTAAVKYVSSHSTIDEAEFDKECGVGYSISPEELLNHVSEFVTSSAVSGWEKLGQTISGVKAVPALRWANPLEIKNAVESVFSTTFGPKEANKPKGKEPAAKAAKPTKDAAKAAEPAPSQTSVFEEGFLGALHKPGGNPQIHPHLKEQHLAATGGQVWTRFPPEPNGYLHIGHSKAIFVNFGYAAHHGGKCYLRYDDTNPEKEEGHYFDSILEMVRWLGYEPWKITYSSDYFDKLHELAVELVRRDKAYVCHCTKDQIKYDRGDRGEGQKREKPRACIHRNRPVEESLSEFEKMKNGEYKPGDANLRMKQDLEDGNPQMWDLTAYRILETPHHRTMDKWKIYPTYDFTHCLVDSFENISHSLCTTEFILSRVSYEWLCDALEVYKPRQSEYGRLNLEGTVMSKRKIHALVDEGFVSGWDDPRLYTLVALRRRGIPPGAILSFVSTLGVSTATTSIETARFENSVRQYLENSAPRLLMVLKPLKVTIENLPEDHVEFVTKPLHPKVSSLGSVTIPFTRTIYIDSEDFRLEDSKDYFRLAPGKTVGLFQAPHPITCTSYKTNPDTGEVVELVCRLENEGPPKKPKAFIQWVAEHAPSGSPVRIDETRIFHPLFKSDKPSGDFRSDIDTNSLEVVKGAFVEVGLWHLAKQAIESARKETLSRAKSSSTPDAAFVDQVVGNECVRFQGLRIAYFALDKDARVSCLNSDTAELGRKQGDYLVLNRIVSLKEDAGKSV
ncbi:Glutaminyl-tRNA synthetase [Marasmius crinis-equi]|uniref:glutamine--tRNA ligase n=1 Tax=Marasmius crinis-equi TaxID=585013 RepID=A0ABR3F4E7_9AGAR